MKRHEGSRDPKWRFVFGSNLRGAHGAGAALDARIYYRARVGVGEGPTGQCYAVPTKGRDMRPLALEVIRASVARFLAYARANPTLTFYVTEIGCGLAGYKPAQIAPMFAGAPSNCDMPEGWR